jgi:hypothetical protein
MLNLPQAHVVLADDGELAEPIAVEPFLEGYNLSLPQRIGTIAIKSILTLTILAVPILLLRITPGIEIASFVFLTAISIAIFVISVYGLCAFYDAHLNPYGYNYDQTLKALHWATIGSLSKLLASFLFSVGKKVLISFLFITKGTSGFYLWNYPNYQDWYRHRRY